MAAKIKFRRLGTKKRPFYRLVVSDHKAPGKGDAVDLLGYYVPSKDKPLTHTQNEKILEWIKRGASPTDSVKKFLVKQGIIQFSESEKSMLSRAYQQAKERKEKVQVKKEEPEKAEPASA